MLPIIVYKESFSVKDTLCSVCLGEYQAEDRLQQIPGCGHTFHMDCIDLWLATHTTCPLCRHSILASIKATHPLGENDDSRTSENDNETSVQSNGDPQTSQQQLLAWGDGSERIIPTISERGEGQIAHNAESCKREIVVCKCHAFGDNSQELMAIDLWFRV